MASKESEVLNRLYRDWVAALEANPEMPLDELRHLFERWGDITGEPGDVDYIETDAGGIPALWAVPKGCAEDRVLLCAHGGGYVVGSAAEIGKRLAALRSARSFIDWQRRARTAWSPSRVRLGYLWYNLIA